jgi:hypothetical protein
MLTPKEYARALEVIIVVFTILFIMAAKSIYEEKNEFESCPCYLDCMSDRDPDWSTDVSERSWSTDVSNGHCKYVCYVKLLETTVDEAIQYFSRD